MNPFKLLCSWADDEQELGALNTKCAVLATVAKDSNFPNSRVVAIRQINNQGVLFFTQKGTKKVHEMESNPNASMTFWFAIKAKQVIINGIIEALSDEENEEHWKTYPREGQIRFYSYAPTSSQPIDDKQELENQREEFREKFKDKEIPVHPLYCGYRLKPSKFVFYTYNSEALSGVKEYEIKDGNWSSKTLSP